MRKKFFIVIILQLVQSYLIYAQEDVLYKPYSFSSNINTEEGGEYLANLTADEKTLYFCGSNRDDNIGYADIFISHFINGEWTKPVVLTDLSTLESSDAPMSVSADGNSIIIFRNSKMYSSYKTVSGWSEPEIFDEVNYKTWNCDAFYTADGNAILFSSGEITPSIMVDIYVIVKKMMPLGLNQLIWEKP